MKKVSVVLALAGLMPALALAQAQQPVRVGGNTKAPERVHYVAPVYPGDAKAAGVSGIVILETTVGVDGAPTEAHIIRSVPGLDMAAIDAVKQWRYRPTLLNGVPVPVIMTVTVNFSLTGGTAALPVEPVFFNGVEALRIGGNIKAPERIKYVTPVYPQEARDGNIQGIVIIEAVIDEAGKVASTRVVRSVQGLDAAAQDAVMQWEYTPTLLNGVPKPVVMTVTVNFTLQ